MTKLPLQGVVVIDLSRLLPGPLCSLLLADLGASVIKVESHLGGDYMRSFPPMHQNMSGMFAALNRNKRSIALDLKQKNERELLLDLLGNADVLLESFRPGVMERLGLSYDTIKASHPHLIYCSISGYGQTGPLATKAGHDLNFIGQMGLLSLAGQTDSPTVPVTQISDVGGSYLGLAHILAALYQREKTQEGCYCDVSLCEGVIPFLTMPWGEMTAASKPNYSPGGMLGGQLPCYCLYQCADLKYLSVACLEVQFWNKFIDALKLDHIRGSAFATGLEGTRVKREIEAVLSQKNRDQWVDFFTPANCCVEPVLTLEELQNSEYAKERGLFEKHDHPTEGSFLLPRSPFRFSDTEPNPHTGAPLLDEHHLEILLESGLDPVTVKTTS